MRGKQLDAPVFETRSQNQDKCIASISKNTYSFLVGYAGTGKTYLATAMALVYLAKQKVSKIVVIRPAISNKHGENVGSLPGTLEEKMLPFAGSVMDNIINWIQPDEVLRMLANGIIEFLPVTFIRGRSFNNCFVIVEEAQNLYKGGVYTVLSRIGEGSKCVFTGDMTQSDIGNNSDLTHAIGKLSKPTLLDDVGIVELNHPNDIQRSETLYSIMERFDKVEIDPFK